MSLRKLFNLGENANKPVFVGFAESNILDSKGRPYWVGTLKSPITIRCSVDVNIPAHEVEELLIREEVLDYPTRAEAKPEDKIVWDSVNPEKPEEGQFIKGWVADFSKGQEAGLYQETTIKAWAKDERFGRKESRDNKVKNNIIEKMKAKGKPIDGQ